MMTTEEVVLRKGRMVVGVDGSPSSIMALEWAAKHADHLGCSIEVISAWERYIPPSDLIASGMPLESQISEEPPEETSRDILKESTAKVFQSARPLDLQLRAIEGDPSHILVQESSTATMLVLGSRGHGKLYNLVLGSVSTSCAAKAHCPVLIVHDRN